MKLWKRGIMFCLVLVVLLSAAGCKSREQAAGESDDFFIYPDLDEYEGNMKETKKQSEPNKRPLSDSVQKPSAAYAGFYPIDDLSRISDICWGYRYVDENSGRDIDEIADILFEGLMRDMLEGDERLSFQIIAYKLNEAAPKLYTAEDDDGDPEFPAYLDENTWHVTFGAYIKYTGEYSFYGEAPGDCSDLDDDIWLDTYSDDYASSKEFIIVCSNDLLLNRFGKNAVEYTLYSRGHYESGVLGDRGPGENSVVNVE